MPLYGRHRSKPTPGTDIDRGSGLASGLQFFTPLWEGFGTRAGDAVNGLGMTLNGTAAWSSGTLGPGLDCLAVGAYGITGAIPQSLRLSNPITLAVALRWNGTNPLGVAQLFGLVTNSSTYAAAYRIQFASATTNVILITSAATSATLATLVSGKESVFVVTIDAGGTLNAYLDGAKTAGPTAGSGASPTYGATSAVYLGGSPSGATAQCRYFGGWIWNRALSADEVRSFSANPWQLFAPPSSYWLLKASAAATVSGSMGVTLAPATFSGTGGFATAGSMGITLAPDVFSGTAGTLSSGSMAKTLNPDVFAGTAAFATSATMAVALAPDVFVGTSGNITVASMAATLAAGVFAGTATAAGAASSGSMNVTLAPAVFVGLTPGVVVISATMAVVLNPDVFAGTANAYPAPAVLALVDPDLASLIVTTADPSIAEADPDAASLIII